MPGKNKSLAPLLWAGACVGGALWLIAPARAKKETRAAFSGRNYAHRGLHSADCRVPENSLPAFEAAARLGYGVELDVRITKDGQLAVFHDEDVQRLCGVPGRVEDMTLAELSRLRLCGTRHGVPLLSQALEVIGGRCPVIVELKRGGRNRELCEKTLAALNAYGGPCCVESFDPRIVRWFRRHAPGLLRGQLAAHPRSMGKETSTLNAFLVGNLLTNFLARPHFIAYELGKKPLSVRLCEALGALRAAWVSLEPGNEARNDAVIFQFYRPKPRFR